jgi:acetylornithine deacetylase/succinyl-diaminopimelate desuccinylase-like protein
MADELQHEATALLQRLVRHNTVNPPGDERALQEELAALLREAGFEVELIGRTEQRPNLIARLRGRDDGPTLCLLSHVDTVLASPGEWTHDPWSGDVEDGFLWGRGAIDMKSQTAAEVTAAVSLAREGWRPAAGDLLVVVVVDEEVGGHEGAIWLTEHHPEKIRCDELLNEGGGSVIPFDGGPLYGVCVAEKGVFRFTLTTTGTAGHASMPRIADNALLKLAPLLDAMRPGRAGFDVTEGPRLLLESLGVQLDGGVGGVEVALDALRARDPGLAVLVEPMLGVTLAPTIVSASEKINVIPSRAQLKVDCRTPPGMGPAAVRERIEAVLAGAGVDGWSIAFDEEVVGNGSPADTPLMDAIRGWIGREVPEATVVPTMLPAFTDSRTFRAAFGDCVAYGFFPHRHMTVYETASLLHAKDERIDVRDLGFATRFFRDIARERLGV